jgi:siroheme synthase-like protein
MLDGEAISALVVGGGKVAARKVAALLDCGARVHVVAPHVDGAVESLAAERAANAGTLRITRAAYAPAQIGDATLVIAATDDAKVNAAVARDAKAAGRLVNVVDAPQSGNCATPAVHRAGSIVVAVTAGGVPSAAARIRDDIARRVDSRLARAVRDLGRLRGELLGASDRERWLAASRELVGESFCADVESGTFAQRLAEWR